MANNRFNKQIQTVPEPMTGGKGVMPLQPSKASLSVEESHPSWGGLPGKAGPNRSNGSPEEKTYAFTQGLAGGKDKDGGNLKDF